MKLTSHKQDSVLNLPTPLARLYGTAMKLDIGVHDFPVDGLAGEDDPAAVVVCGAAIAINPALEGDDLRADVLAMALEVAAIMTNREAGDPGEIYAPGGFVVITRNRVPAPRTGPGSLATLIARRCGRDTASAVFGYYVPAFESCFPSLVEDGQG